ncbi:MAG: Spy/CpxP family protein refolding chaperone [Ignavibacteriae bacterium]|nr:Spy/CpxP family protein refolding chaperone [Ignavibacteriota bacterium]
MRHIRIVLLLVVSLNDVAFSQTSPYVGQERHDIKALSPKEIQDYFAGAGMGFAKAAELNSYPGPKHVLELADSLELTELQLTKTKKPFQSIKAKAMRLGKSIVHQEHELDKLFASKTVDNAALTSQTERIARLQGELRSAHLEAHLAMRQVLSLEQIRKYDELRGYSKQSGTSHDGNMHKH